MLKHLQTNTTVSVVDGKMQSVEGMSSLPAFKVPSSAEVIAIREVPAALAFSFRFKDVYDITHFHYLMEGTTRYRVVGVETFNTPFGAHTRVHAEMKAGT